MCESHADDTSRHLETSLRQQQNKLVIWAKRDTDISNRLFYGSRTACKNCGTSDHPTNFCHLQHDNRDNGQQTWQNHAAVRTTWRSATILTEGFHTGVQHIPATTFVCRNLCSAEECAEDCGPAVKRSQGTNTRSRMPITIDILHRLCTIFHEGCFSLCKLLVSSGSILDLTVRFGSLGHTHIFGGLMCDN